jgi:hypothetical protein
MWALLADSRVNANMPVLTPRVKGARAIAPADGRPPENGDLDPREAR